MESLRSWSTGNELEYLKQLVYGGLFSGPGCGHRCQVPVEVLLGNYINSAKKRKKWGTFGYVDPDVVIGYAEEMRSKLIFITETLHTCKKGA